MSRYVAVYNVVFPFPMSASIFFMIFHIYGELIFSYLTTNLYCVKLSSSDFRYQMEKIDIFIALCLPIYEDGRGTYFCI